MTAAALRIEEVRKHFGDTAALKGVTFEVRPREVVGLVGENGAGKSTLLKVLAGLIPHDSGRLILRGTVVRWRSVVEAANAGIGLMFQEQSLVPSVSVAENVLLGHEGLGVRLGVFRWQRLLALAQRQLDKVGAAIAPAAATASLSFAGQYGLIVWSGLHFAGNLAFQESVIRSDAGREVETSHRNQPPVVSPAAGGNFVQMFVAVSSGISLAKSQFGGRPRDIQGGVPG